jgi:molybdopterin molybdotransferase
MISYQEAQTILIARARSFGKERVALNQAYGRVLSETIKADRDYPPFDRSSMDGYAIRFSDFEQGMRQFRITETIFAGSAGTRPVASGECCKIMTGAPVPSGADMVVRREEVLEEAGEIRMNSDAGRPYLNISRRGEDLQSGETVLDRACICGPAIMGLLASLGKKEFLVGRLPRIALLTTGDEVVQVDEAVSPVQIRNSNRWLLQSLLKEQGIAPYAYAHMPDDRAILLNSLENYLTGNSLIPDMVILSGGVSAGDADHVPGVLQELGVEKLFHKMAIKPGRPAWCGTHSGGTVVFALPGNPFSCLVGFVLLVRPYLHACFGLPLPGALGLPLRESRKKKTPLDEFFPVYLGGSPAVVSSVRFNGSGDVRLGSQANAIALHPAGSGDLATGEMVDCFPL